MSSPDVEEVDEVDEAESEEMDEAEEAEEAPGKVLFEINGYLDEYYSLAVSKV